jgi:integrase
MQHKELADGVWNLPASRNKVKADLTRPLSRAAQAILDERPRFDGCPFIFTNDGKRKLWGFSYLKKQFDKACKVSGWQLHDLRRTARSLMSKAGVAADHAERCLGHAIGGVRGTYDRHDYRPEMQHAYEALAAQIECIINPPPPNVRQLRRSR